MLGTALPLNTSMIAATDVHTITVRRFLALVHDV